MKYAGPELRRGKIMLDSNWQMFFRVTSSISPLWLFRRFVSFSMVTGHGCRFKIEMTKILIPYWVYNVCGRFSGENSVQTNRGDVVTVDFEVVPGRTSLPGSNFGYKGTSLTTVTFWHLMLLLETHSFFFSFLFISTMMSMRSREPVRLSVFLRAEEGPVRFP